MCKHNIDSMYKIKSHWEKVAFRYSVQYKVLFQNISENTVIVNNSCEKKVSR